MNNSAGFDSNTLAAVKPGLDGALAEISLQMERYLKAPAENEDALETVCGEVHRMIGVLKMVGLDGLVVFCAEFEQALSELKGSPSRVSNLYRDALRSALFALTHFLDALADGADNATLRLFPQYQELQQLRGLEMSFELDLFYPRLDVQLPQQILKPPQAEGAASRLKQVRTQYQQGLLRWLRDEDATAALQTMQQAAGAAMFCAPQDASRAFWWVAYGLLEVLKLDALPPEMNVRKLLGRIDQQMRLAAEGQGGEPGEVQSIMNEMLYVVGSSQADSEHVRVIKRVYSLDKYLPREASLQFGELEQQLAIMRDQLRVAEESWDLCVQGDSAACEKFCKYVEQLKAQSEKFDPETLQYLAGQIHALSQYATAPEHARPIAIDMAMALLLLRSGIENYARLGSGFQEQARILSERMHAGVRHLPEDANRLSELVDLHYQTEQQVDVMSTLANEMLVNLQRVEEGLNAFFNDTTRRGDLVELLRLLSQIQGGLRISSLKHAEQLLLSIQKKVQRYSQSDSAPRPAERYALADAMSALENYMQHLTHGQSGDVSRLQLALVDMEKADQAPLPAAPPAAAKAAQPPPVAPARLETAPTRLAPAVPELLPTPAAVVLPPAAFEPPPAIELPPMGGVTAELRPAPVVVEPIAFEPPTAAVAAVSFEPPPAAPPAQAEQPQAEKRRSEEEQELLDIFLEEAQDVLSIMRGNLETCRRNPEDHDALVAIRRGFHTLKGSGRMVGLTDLGEVAWCVERALNKWLQEKELPTPGLLTFIGKAEQSFTGWVNALMKEGDAHIEASALTADAQRLEEGVDLGVPTAAAPEAVPVAPGAVQPAEVVPSLDMAAEAVEAPWAPPEPELITLPDLTLELEAKPELPAETGERSPAVLESMTVLDFELAPAFEPVAEAAPHIEPISLPELDLELAPTEPVEKATEPQEAVIEPLPALDFDLAAPPLTEEKEGFPPELAFAPEFNLEAAPEPITPSPEAQVLAPEPAPEPMPVLDFQLEELLMPEAVGVAEQQGYGAEEPKVPQPPAEAEEEKVSIGDVTLPLDLFEIASLEAMQNVSILRKELNELRAGVSPTVQYDFLRAAHTLGGVSRTMGFAAIVSLAHALEEWLRDQVERPSALGTDEMQMLDEAVAALDGMVQNICDLQMPSARNDLASRLAADKGKPRVVAQAPLIVPAAPAVPSVSGRAEQTLAAFKPAEPPAVTARAPAESPAAALMALKTAEEGAEGEKPPVYDDVDEQLLPVFLEEADDLVPKIGDSLRSWRENTGDEQLEHSLKRLLHTMKGSSRMVGAMRIGEIAHDMETQVMAAAKLRDEAGYWEKLEGDFDRINALLVELRGGKPVVEEKPEPVKYGRRATDQPAGVERRAERRGEPLIGNMLRVRAEVVDRLVNEASEVNVVRSRIETEVRRFKEGLLDLTDSVARLRQQLREVEIQAESQMQAKVSLVRDTSEHFDPLEFDRFTRLQELTRFMNESVHDVQTVQHSLLKNLDETASVIQHQGRLNRELQQGLMNVRMVSFNSITDRLYRIVRQTCKELNKRANLELQGTGVEMDRSILEKMIAPFEHLLRNSIVHGLESALQREQSGKNPIGEIRLSVHQESNEMVFEFSDDGAGLNYPKLREKGIARGAVHPDETISDDRLAELIFLPGLSTAAEVTEIAGRGVGMDVVRSEIAALGGRIEVSSKRGHGTQFLIHLPLTLAVTNVVMVRSGEAAYAIPSAMVEQVKQVKMKEMEALHRDNKINWQGNPYPLHYLPHLLGNVDVTEENQLRNAVLLLRSGDQRVALHVDELLGNEEAMVKNIGPQLARLPWIAGATVLGNGEVVLMLNPIQLGQRVATATKTVKEVVEVAPLNALPVIMVVDDSLTVRKITSRMLVRAGYQVVTATDGVDALEKLDEMGDAVPEVMLLDIEMPRMDGFALAKHLRRDPKTHGMPIIMITSRTADKHRDYAMQLGVNTYLGKPYQEDELLQNIADFVAAHKLDT